MAALAMLLLGVRAAEAAAEQTAYVDGGSVGGLCSDARSVGEASSVGTPWCSLSRAVGAAPSGSTVLVRAGVYPKLSVGFSGSRGSLVTFRAFGGERVEVDGLYLDGANLLRFEGFRFVDDVDVRDGASRVELVGNELVGRRVWLYRTSDVLVEGNHIHDIPVGNSGGTIGVRLMHDERPVVRNNLIENLVEDPIQATKVTSALIEGNVLHNAFPVSGQHTDTIHVLGGDGVTIRGNYARDIQHGLMFTDFQPLNVTVENNVISRIKAGMSFNAYAGGMPGLRVVNNTFWESRYGVGFRVQHPNAVVVNNIFDQVSGLGSQPVAAHNLVARPGSDTDYGQRAILADPLLADPAAGNFELGATSPAIDTGTSTGTPTIDQKRRARHDEPTVPNQGTGTQPYYDLGALEYGADDGAGLGSQGPSGGPRRGCMPAGRLKVRMARRTTLRRARRRGISLRVRTPTRHRVIRLSVRRRGKVIHRATVRGRARSRRVRLDGRRLRRRLRPGRYTVRLRSGPSVRRLGRSRCITFRVVRHRHRLRPRHEPQRGRGRARRGRGRGPRR